MEPQPVVSWFRVGTFFSTVGAGILALESASPEVKAVTVIALLVINAALTVFFPTVNGASVVSAVKAKLSK